MIQHNRFAISEPMESQQLSKAPRVEPRSATGERIQVLHFSDSTGRSLERWDYSDTWQQWYHVQGQDESAEKPFHIHGDKCRNDWPWDGEATQL